MATISQREAQLKEEVERRLPEFCQTVKNARNGRNNVVLHQDAFAADYQPEEYRLLGMAIKYAGLYGVEIIFGGENRETLA